MDFNDLKSLFGFIKMGRIAHIKNTKHQASKKGHKHIKNLSKGEKNHLQFKLDHVQGTVQDYLDLHK